MGEGRRWARGGDGLGEERGKGRRWVRGGDGWGGNE